MLRERYSAASKRNVHYVACSTYVNKTAITARAAVFTYTYISGTTIWESSKVFIKNFVQGKVKNWSQSIKKHKINLIT